VLCSLLMVVHASDTGLAGLDALDLVRVDDPDHPDAIARSATGAVLSAPPESGSWSREVVPGVDAYQAHEAVTAIAAEPWHEAGFTGAGVSVAVFDLQWFGSDLVPEELGDVATWDCWAHARCTVEMDNLRPRFAYENGNHGVACAEVVRDLAPDADLHLVRVNGRTTFENAAAWAIREGIDVVSMSLSFYADSFHDGTGPVNAIAEDLADAGVLVTVSAGNSARGHWQERFSDADADGLHGFPWGSEYLPIYLEAGGTRKITVMWDEFGRCGETDLDVRVYRGDGALLDRSEGVQAGGSGCEPVERVNPQVDDDGWVYLQIERVAGGGDVRFDVLTRAGDVYQSMAGGSTADPASHPGSWTVGAVAGTGYLDNGAESFSSYGPTNGGEPKPDIAAPDGVSGSAYGARGFYGTSASAPVAAAAAALVLSRYEGLTPREAADKLESWAMSDGAVFEGPDQAYGAGKLRLPPPDASGGCGAGLFYAVLLLPLGVLGRR